MLYTHKVKLKPKPSPSLSQKLIEALYFVMTPMTPRSLTFLIQLTRIFFLKGPFIAKRNNFIARQANEQILNEASSRAKVSRGPVRNVKIT